MKRIFGLILVAAFITLPISYWGCGSVTSVSGGDEDVDNQADTSVEEDGGQAEDVGTDSGEQSDAGQDGGVVEDGSTGDSGSDAGIDGGKTDAGTPDGGVKDGGVTACGPLNEGHNVFKVGSLTRDVIFNFPSGVESGGPWPVIFNWHGLGDTADNMAGIVSDYVDNPGYPFILVTPEDTDFVVSYMGYGYNMDWEVFKVNAATNREALLFDKVIGCLKEKFKIDDNRIHSIGFSMGSIATDMLGTIRGAKLASTITFSGGYFSNQDDVDTLGLLKGQVSWPAPNHSNGYQQVILYGGTTDTFDMTVAVIHFDTFATNDKTYLNGLGHDVVICNHNAGHTAPRPDFQAPQMLEFLKAHPLGTVDSPYKSGLPKDYPAYCTFSGKK